MKLQTISDAADGELRILFRTRDICGVLLLMLMPFACVIGGEDGWFEETSSSIHGFYEIRSGYRTRNDPYEKDMSIMEQRLQIDFTSFPSWGDIRVKGDVVGDLVTEEADFDLREANVFLRPLDYMDLKAGRQILTWGTGDLIFINDLFPKDWQSFFIGRDDEYLKAPSDAVKAGFFTDMFNLDIVFTPAFDEDRYISGERLSYWDSNQGRRAGRGDIYNTNTPDRYFQDTEIAARLYRYIEGYEVALYGYRGFWKSPGGQTANAQLRFPDLNVYGASLRGEFGEGIGNLEFGYYQSVEDEGGTDPLVDNSEIRYLAGYSQELVKNLTASFQYYVEQMMDYDGYIDNLSSGPARDEFRHLITVRLTQLLMNQNLECSLFTYYSPTDKDAHLRPRVNYKVNDNLEVEAGANIFLGDYPNTFFGQMENNTNIYSAVRYSF